MVWGLCSRRKRACSKLEAHLCAHLRSSKLCIRPKATLCILLCLISYWLLLYPGTLSVFPSLLSYCFVSIFAPYLLCPGSSRSSLPCYVFPLVPVSLCVEHSESDDRARSVTSSQTSTTVHSYSPWFETPVVPLKPTLKLQIPPTTGRLQLCL